MPRKVSPNTESTTIKLSQDLLDRAERLAVQANENFVFAHATRTEVLRVAIEVGMKQLEARAKARSKS